MARDTLTADELRTVNVWLATCEHMTRRVRALREKIAAGVVPDLAAAEDELRSILDEVARVDVEAEVRRIREATEAVR